MNEKQVDAKVVRWFKKAYPKGVCIKLAVAGAHGVAGWPDRLFAANGKVCFAEMKAPGKVPTALQHERIKQLQEIGLRANYFDEPDDCIAWVGMVLGRP